MWETKSTWHCSWCDSILVDKNSWCGECWRAIYIDKLKNLPIKNNIPIPTLEIEWDEDHGIWKEKNE